MTEKICRVSNFFVMANFQSNSDFNSLVSIIEQFKDVRNVLLICKFVYQFLLSVDFICFILLVFIFALLTFITFFFFQKLMKEENEKEQIEEGLEELGEKKKTRRISRKIQIMFNTLNCVFYVVSVLFRCKYEINQLREARNVSSEIEFTKCNKNLFMWLYLTSSKP